MLAPSDISDRLARFPRARLGHLPTPIEPMDNLAGSLSGPRLLVKRDDCTGVALGGNKVRQLEFYLGAAQAAEADTVLITGAVQSNFVRVAAAMARRLSMQCHIQLEERVPHSDALYRASGNVLLDRVLGATLHSYPHGEDEAGADAAVEAIAERLRGHGARPYVVPLGPGHPPLGALGYVVAAQELLAQLADAGQAVDRIYVASGSAATHTGLVWGLRASGSRIPVTGVCVRRPADRQQPRVAGKLVEISEMLGIDLSFEPEDVRLTDDTLAPGYGRLNEATREAFALAARCEGLILDPVYTAKVMAAMIAAIRAGEHGDDKTLLFVHTGGQPALFGYGEDVLPAEEACV
ncbi:MAG: D-cysteine desulfhydrase family protein [Alphaproteobacteria bacterium]|nr:D-cysteine desulfhydrase family protein [Alphaproteobacteria bacterium]